MERGSFINFTTSGGYTTATANGNETVIIYWYVTNLRRCLGCTQNLKFQLLGLNGAWILPCYYYH